MRTFFSLLLLLLIAVAPSAGQSVMDISRAYLQAEMDLDWTRMQALYADSMRFQDPTGTAFGTAAGGIPIAGKEQVLATQRGWGLTKADFDIDHSFHVGEYALHRGTYHVRFEGSDATYDIDFVTVHRVVDGKIASRLDFGDYAYSFQMSDSLQQVSERTATLAREYLDAYFGEDMESQRRMLHPDVRFQDPTAGSLGPAYGQLIEGAESLLTRRARTYANISGFGMDIQHSFASGNHAAFAGSVTYTTRNGMTYVQPAVMIVEVQGGKVVRHWDFVDYSVQPGS